MVKILEFQKKSGRAGDLLSKNYFQSWKIRGFGFFLSTELEYAQPSAQTA